jgi:guanosine-3',5'-bis(diphosphate) 3'-pyrophosphohydrolase
VAAEIGESDANITYVGMDEDDEHMMTQLRFTIQVKDRVHLAHLIRNLRRVAGVNRVERERAPDSSPLKSPVPRRRAAPGS